MLIPLAFHIQELGTHCPLTYSSWILSSGLFSLHLGIVYLFRRLSRRILDVLDVWIFGIRWSVLFSCDRAYGFIERFYCILRFKHILLFLSFTGSVLGLYFTSMQFLGFYLQFSNTA